MRSDTELPEPAREYECVEPTLTGGNGGGGTSGPLGGKGGQAGGSATAAGERGGDASGLAGNGGSGGGGLEGAARPERGRRASRPACWGGAGTSWYDTSEVTGAAVNTTNMNVDTPGTLNSVGVIIGSQAS